METKNSSCDYVLHNLLLPIYGNMGGEWWSIHGPKLHKNAPSKKVINLQWMSPST